MKRPWQVWLVFVACAAAAAVAMVWLTRQALEADRMRGVAEAEAELEQRVSLALWRMDTALAPIVAEEVIRPASAYEPTITPVKPPPFVVLQFQVVSDGFWVSPQIPSTQSYPEPELAQLSQSISFSQLLAMLPSTPLPTAAAGEQHLVASNEGQAAEIAEESDDPFQYFAGNTAKPPAPVQEPAPDRIFGKGKSQFSKAADFEKRGERYQSAARQSLLNTQQQQQQVSSAPNAARAVQTGNEDDANGSPAEQVGVSRPVWVGERLILARRVGLNGGTVVQGCWLDWRLIKERLLNEATDLLPDADLVPVNGASSQDPGRMLAGLPVRLVVNEIAVASGVGPTLQWALWIGWGAVLLAAAAAAALLHGVMSLSERRAAFVSSVTHELRTPLTTFRMYAQMLARGMVPDAAQRQEYFSTLEREAGRLTLLVENVLAYARLERGRKPHAVERVTLAGLLDRVGPRLCQRAQQAGMRCVVELGLRGAKSPSPCPLPTAEGFEQEFTTDLNVVEQILFNLVDNAAKYARDVSDNRIHVEANHTGAWTRLAVRDHGPGIESRRLSRRMQPFGKSAQESAETAPGVGLGLALCRRLARQLGGRLEIGATPGGGATVTLLLPAR